MVALFYYLVKTFFIQDTLELEAITVFFILYIFLIHPELPTYRDLFLSGH